MSTEKMKIMENLFERILILVKALEKNSQSAFAKKIGCQQSTFNGYLNEQGQTKIRKVLLDAILTTYPQISREWLYFGEGEMLRGQNAGVAPLRVAVPPLLPAVAPTPDDGDLAQRLLDAYAQNARLAEELVRANEERRRLQELLGLDKEAGAAHMPTSALGARPDAGRD